MLAAVVVLFVFSGVTWRTPSRDVAASFGVALVFSFCIGPMLAAVMARIAPPIWNRFAFPGNWVVSALVMVAVAMVGSSMAIGILALVGIVAAGHLTAWFIGSLNISIVIPLTFGLFTTAAEPMRSRLAAATLALRTKERDEAHARHVAAEAQLASLESRVHPHFFFNTLNSIAALIPQDPASAERVVGQLASLLRFSLDLDPLVTLERELKLVADYLAIERVRFAERLRYRFEVDAAVARAVVPRLSVQTLVENSVKYAVSPRREGASIVVVASVNAGIVTVAVADDRPGFSGQEADDDGPALLRSRLGAQFGDAAWLSISRDEPWTRVALTIPLNIEEPIS